MSDHHREFIYNIPESVLVDSRLTDTDRRVYSLVRSFMDTTGNAFFSNSWAAEKINKSERSISRAISKLVECAHIKSKTDEKTGKRYLYIIYKTQVANEVSQQGVDKNVQGGRQKCLGGVDKNVHLLDQSTITPKINKKINNKKDYESNQTYVKPSNYRPASHDIWSEEKYQASCIEASRRVDPNDWREVMIKQKMIGGVARCET